MTPEQRAELIRAVRANLPLRGVYASTERPDSRSLMQSVTPRGRRGTGALRGSAK